VGALCRTTLHRPIAGEIPLTWTRKTVSVCILLAVLAILLVPIVTGWFPTPEEWL